MWRELLIKDLTSAKIGVFGIPIDENTSIGKGASFAPKEIRENSEFLPPYTIDGHEITSSLYDFGDIEIFDFEKVKEYTKKSLKCGFAICLGGDHSISILTERAFKELNTGKVGLIHIDAHADICDIYQNSKYSHACVNYRAIENGYKPEDITMIGIRSYERQEKELLNKIDLQIISSNEFINKGRDYVVKQLIDKYKNYDSIYLSFDIDALDPSFAPGTGTPEAFGLNTLDLLHVIIECLKNLPIKMMDIVEVSPPLDNNNVTVWTALKFLLEIIYVINSKEVKGE